MSPANELKVCIQDAKDAFNNLAENIGAFKSSSLTPESLKSMSVYEVLSEHLQATAPLISVRESAREILENLPSATAPQSNTVQFGGVQMPFEHARLLAFQGYLTTTWSICDRLTLVAGRVFCSSTYARRADAPPLVEVFLRTTSQDIPAHLQNVLRHSYAWPTALSYAARNLLVHEGGMVDGRTVFSSQLPDEDAFCVTPDGSKNLEQRAQVGRADVNSKGNRIHIIVSSQCRRTGFPGPERDLLVILKSCTEEMDEMLVVILRAAVGMSEAMAKELYKRDA